MGKVIGIDLGTTNSCVSVIEADQPVVIVNAEGKRTTPSVIGFNEGEIKIGDPARRQAVTNPTNTLSSVKRFIGSNFDDVKKEAKKMPYVVKKGSDNRVIVEANGRDYIPQEIAAMVLQNLKRVAEDYLGSEVTEAVITVPAYFNDAQRQATKEAGEIAGLSVLRIINEPTAAALAYGLDKMDKDQKVAVYDLGGGTFDVSILEIGSGVFEVLSTNGDTHLGGDNFDEKIIDFIVDEFKSQTGIDASKDPMAYQRIREAAEKAKIELSNSSDTEINLPYLSADSAGPKHFVGKLSRAKFEQMIDDLIQKTLAPCRKAIKDSKLKVSEIDEILLVGGSTRIPKVQEEVEKLFGKKPNKSVNPDEVVAIGAAVQGAVLKGEITDVLLLDVTPLSLGIETMGGVFTKLIEANSTIPIRKSESFSTAVDNQANVEIHVLQGERPMASDNNTLGRFMLTDVPPAPRGVPQIEVTFDIDANGIISVSAKDKGTGKEQNIKIESGNKLTEDEIKKMKDDALSNEKADKERLKLSQAKNELDGLIFQAEKMVKDFEEKTSEEERAKINSMIESAKETVKGEDVEKMESSTKDLVEALQEISTKVYAQEQDNSGEPGETTSSTSTEAEEVEFEEVKG